MSFLNFLNLWVKLRLFSKSEQKIQPESHEELWKKKNDL